MTEPIEEGTEAGRAVGDVGGMPRWVKVSFAVAAALVVLIVVLLVLGGHGPGRHMAPQGSEHTSPAVPYP